MTNSDDGDNEVVSTKESKYGSVLISTWLEKKLEKRRKNIWTVNLRDF